MDDAQQAVSGSAVPAPGGTPPQSPAAEAPTPFPWPIQFMKQAFFKKGDVVFNKGDAADRMFYIRKGSIRLVEIEKTLGEDEVLGEMGIFSPLGQRTVSAVCLEDLEAYSMGRDDVLQYFQRDPARGLDLIHISFRRFIENLKAETEAVEKIESELRIAQQIQSSMLPRTFPRREEFEIFAMMDPAKEVGGDFYDFFYPGEGKLCFVIGDVSGKGVPAALFMAITRTLIRNAASSGVPTNEILATTNRHLFPDNETLMFVTAFCAVMDVETGKVQYCNAGHNPPLILKKSGEVEFLKMPSGFVLGVQEESTCERMPLQLEPGDAIFLYTDGVTEAMSPGRTLFSEARLKQCLEKVRDQSVEQIVRYVQQEVYAHAAGAEQSDDITMLALRYRGKA